MLRLPAAQWLMARLVRAAIAPKDVWMLAGTRCMVQAMMDAVDSGTLRHAFVGVGTDSRASRLPRPTEVDHPQCAQKGWPGSVWVVLKCRPSATESRQTRPESRLWTRCRFAFDESEPASLSMFSVTHPLV